MPITVLGHHHAHSQICSPLLLLVLSDLTSPPVLFSVIILLFSPYFPTFPFTLLHHHVCSYKTPQNVFCRDGASCNKWCRWFFLASGRVYFLCVEPCRRLPRKTMQASSHSADVEEHDWIVHFIQNPWSKTCNHGIPNLDRKIMRLGG